MEPTNDFLLSNIQKLLNSIGDPAFCRGCGKRIWWIKHKNGKKAPYTDTALNHFADCTHADQFKMDLK